MKIKNTFFIYLILFFTSTAHGYLSKTDESLPFTLFFDDETPLLVTDFRGEIEFLFNIPEKHHLYREKIEIKFDSDKISHTLVKPAGILKYDEFMGMETEVYEHQLAVLAKVQFARDFDFKQALTGAIYYQGCSNKICFRSVETRFKFVSRNFKTDRAREDSSQNKGIQPRPPRGFPSGHQSQVSNLLLNPDHKALAGQMITADQHVSNTRPGVWEILKKNDLGLVLKQGLFLAILFTFIAGVLTGFTPCVLPIIPLTLAFIGVTPQAKGARKFNSLLVFVLGMVLTNSFLGILSALIGKTHGFYYQRDLFLVLLILFLVLMGLWLVGVVNLSLSSKIQTGISRFQPKSGVVRNLFAGLTIGVLAAPCVGPVLGPLLVYISTRQDLFLGTVLMLSYSLGLSVVFFILGFFSRGWVARFGEKSNIIKKLLSILLFVTAFYYLYVLVNPWVGSKTSDDSFFKNDLKVAVSLAKKENKKVLVDFYADWCLPCKEWDQLVWSKENVRGLVVESFVPVKINCTKETGPCADAVKTYQVIGWPTILFIDEKGDEIKDRRIVGDVMEAEEFMDYIRMLNQ
ncbi:MAG: thioredoxin family protein [Deltaproteobacteria bacterium]|nr:thioredoxin family protein [Deltaproteobacteria bacterium]